MNTQTLETRGLRGRTAFAVGAEAQARTHTTYTVQVGDTLDRIAAAQLGNPFRWPEIWAENRDLGASCLLYAGMVLILPPRIAR